MKTALLVTATLIGALISGCVPAKESTVPNSQPISTSQSANEKNDAIRITPLAAQKILESAPTPDAVLRIDITGNPTDDFTYKMDFDTPDRSDDLKMVQHEVNLVVSQSILYLCEGTTIDWESRGNGGGFRFKNPNADN
jgi:iron-sulfur cluster assembly accessory protein